MDVAELALSQGWVRSLDEFWADEPNEDRERGLTVPRLLDLIDGYARRRRRELRELAVAARVAQADEKKFARALDRVFRDPRDREQERAELPTSGPLALPRGKR